MTSGPFLPGQGMLLVHIGPPRPNPEESPLELWQLRLACPGCFHWAVQIERKPGDLAEVLDNLGVFRSSPDDLVAICPSGFRRVPIAQGAGFYLSLQGFAPNQIAYAHTHPDSEEWVVALRGGGEAFVADAPLALSQALMIGRAAAHPHGFLSGDLGLVLLSIQLPRPAEGATTWDQPGETTEPIDCAVAGTCRRCYRCGGHSLNVKAHLFLCENCGLEF